MKASEVAISGMGRFEYLATNVAGGLPLHGVLVSKVPLGIAAVPGLVTTVQADVLITKLGDALWPVLCQKREKRGMVSVRFLTCESCDTFTIALQSYTHSISP